MSLVIAIDGPSGSGKSTLSRRLAEHFGLAYLDTGSTYRAATIWAVAGVVIVCVVRRDVWPALAAVGALAGLWLLFELFWRLPVRGRILPPVGLDRRVPGIIAAAIARGEAVCAGICRWAKGQNP